MQKLTIYAENQQPLELLDAGKRGVRTQFGALCWRRREGAVQVLLVTSRGSGRWIIPKGWPLDRATPAESAATEAWEESGVEGKVKPVCLGIFSYNKEIMDGEEAPCVVAVFPVKVEALKKAYPEAHQRRRKWFSLKKAAKIVDEPELTAILAGFDPDKI